MAGVEAGPRGGVDMSGTEQSQIDLTGQPDHLRVVEILTDAGVARVNTGLVTTTDGWGYHRQQPGAEEPHRDTSGKEELAMPTGEEWWPFGHDAVRDDPLTEKRIAVVRSRNPRWHYMLAVLIMPEDQDGSYDPVNGKTWLYGQALRPNEAETAQLVSHLEYGVGRWSGSYRTQLSQRALDVDGMHGNLILCKCAEDDWVYGSQTWTSGPMMVPEIIYADMNGISCWQRHPGRPVKGYTHDGPLTLEQLLTKVVTRESARWIEWKRDRPEVWPPRSPEALAADSVGVKATDLQL